MIAAAAIELRAGARVLLEPSSFRLAAGDRIGLVGRNGAGKTTLLKVLAGEDEPEQGGITRSGAAGYLPQDPRTGDLEVLASDRILSGRGLDQLMGGLRQAQESMASGDALESTHGIDRYAQLEERFEALGGYAAEAEAASMASGAAWSWRGCCSAAPAHCCWMSRPTTSTPTRSPGCDSSCAPIVAA